MKGILEVLPLLISVLDSTKVFVSWISRSIFLQGVWWVVMNCPGNSMSPGGTSFATAGKLWMTWFPTKEAVTSSFESINIFSAGRFLWWWTAPFSDSSIFTCRCGSHSGFLGFARINTHYFSIYIFIYMYVNTNSIAHPLCQVSISVAEGKLDVVILISCLHVHGKNCRKGWKPCVTCDKIQWITLDTISWSLSGRVFWSGVSVSTNILNICTHKIGLPRT